MAPIYEVVLAVKFWHWLSFDHVATLVDEICLAWIVWQGQKIMFYEREVHRIQSEREKERSEWRAAKRKQTVKKMSTTTPVSTVGEQGL